MTISHTSSRGRFLVLLMILCQACLCLAAQAPKESGTGAQPQQTPEFRPIVVQMSYYAKPGKEAEVLEWRVHACEVLQKLGTLHGRVFRYVQGPRASSNTDHADVIWEGEFTEQESFDRYERIASTSP